MAAPPPAGDTPWMGARTEKAIDSAIGIAGTACGIGLSLKIVGWVAGVESFGQIGDWLTMPVLAGLLVWMVACYLTYLVLLPAALVRAVVRAWRGDWPLVKR
jgi:hypothetical protein